MSCLIDYDLDDAVMSYDAFLYVLRKTAADDDAGTFRTAFESDPEGTLAAASYSINAANLDPAMRLPSRDDAQSMLDQYQLDHDGAQASLRKVPRNIGNRYYGDPDEQV